MCHIRSTADRPGWFCRGPCCIYMYIYIYIYIYAHTPPRGRPLSEPALRGGANRLSRLPWFVPQAAGFRRAPVQIKDLKKAIWWRVADLEGFAEAHVVREHTPRPEVALLQRLQRPHAPCRVGLRASVHQPLPEEPHSLHLFSAKVNGFVPQN